MLDDIKIEKSETQEKRTQMFRLWLASQPEASHRQLVEALKLKVIGEHTMAVEYEEKVKQQSEQTREIIVTSQEDSTQELGNKSTCMQSRYHEHAFQYCSYIYIFFFFWKYVIQYR